MDEVARAETEIHHLDQATPNHERGEPTARPHLCPQAQTQTQTQTTRSSVYPFNCLVFVRNVHQGTNKTLKSLFAQRSNTKTEAGKDANSPTCPRPPVWIALTLARAWTQCVFDPYLISFSLCIFAGHLR